MSFYKKNPDIIIRNCKIIDGTGKPAFFGDIAIIGDKIDYIGNLKGVAAKEEIDAKFKLVTPGFIDSHTHLDWTVWCDPECENLVTQGVTTAITGNCGYSMTHYLKGFEFDEKGKDIVSVYDVEDPLSAPKGSMAAVLDKVDKIGFSINTAWFCGHNDLRILANIHSEDYTEEQFAIMEGFLREALEAGFIGLSTGLEFDPGVMSKPEEVERLAKIAAEYDGNYASHMRDEGTYIFDAVEEFLNVLRKTGIRGTISHLNVKYDNGIPNEYLQISMQKVKDAKENEHLNVFADMLPTCYASGLAQAVLPPWLYADGWDKARKILADPEGREKVKADMCRYWRFLSDGQWDRLLGLMPSYMPEVAGVKFSEIVKKWGKEPVDCFLDIVAAAPTIEDIRAVMMQGIVFHEQTMIDSVIKDPIYLWMTDSRVAPEEGPVAKLVNNMQDYMSMTYFLLRYVRELGVISIEDAVKKATSLPAHHYRLENRGILQAGNYADINIFDLDNLKINSTFAAPCKYSEGMDYVFVNGTPVIKEGKLTLSRAGRTLRHKA